MYDFKGLTFQGTLDEFWREAADEKVDTGLFEAFRNYLIVTTQINGNFYKRIKGEKAATGLSWIALANDAGSVQPNKFRSDSHIHG